MGRIEGDQVRPMASMSDFYTDTKAALALSGPAIALASVMQAPFVPTTAKVLCAGLNYRAHADEAGRDPPKAPDLFARFASTLVTDGAAVPAPHEEPGLDWEGELAVVLARDVHLEDAAAVEDAVLGYACSKDLSARQHQRAGRQWAVGKNADSSCPIGPWLVTADEIADPYDLRVVTRVGDEIVQDGNTAQMIFRVGAIGAFAAECMTLRAGDVILTGTPSGVGIARKPPRFLTPGDTVTVEIERIGSLRTTIVDPLPSTAAGRA